MNARARAEFEILKDKSRCINCGVCQKQCANKVYEIGQSGEWLIADERCVNCQRCVEMCPTGALKVIKNRNEPRSDGNWQLKAVREIYKQAESGGVLLSSMGNPSDMPAYFDKIAVNASQVTNPPIDPLRETYGNAGIFGRAKQGNIKGQGRKNTARGQDVEAGRPSHVFRHVLWVDKL